MRSPESKEPRSSSLLPLPSRRRLHARARSCSESHFVVWGKSGKMNLNESSVLHRFSVKADSCVGNLHGEQGKANSYGTLDDEQPSISTLVQFTITETRAPLTARTSIRVLRSSHIGFQRRPIHQIHQREGCQYKAQRCELQALCECTNMRAERAHQGRKG
jgi:hypothetical protein